VTGPTKRYRVVVCRGPECGERRGSASLHECFQREVKALGLGDMVELGWQACFGRCRQGPNVLVRLAPTAPPRTLLATPPVGPGQNAALYGSVREEHVAKILQTHVGRGIIVRELVLKPDAIVVPGGGPARAGTPGPAPRTANAPSMGDESTSNSSTSDKESGGEPK
jgi:(2Fe-2S) ferredoxin